VTINTINYFVIWISFVYINLFILNTWLFINYHNIIVLFNNAFIHILIDKYTWTYQNCLTYLVFFYNIGFSCCNNFFVVRYLLLWIVRILSGYYLLFFLTHDWHDTFVIRRTTVIFLILQLIDLLSNLKL